MLRQQTDLDRLKISVEQAKLAQQEAVQRNTPELALPKILLPNKVPQKNDQIPLFASRACTMSSCFDHSRCSLTSGFPVFLYDPDTHPVTTSVYEVDGFLKTTIKQTFGYNPHFTHDPKSACIFLVLVGESLYDENTNGPAVSGSNSRYGGTTGLKNVSSTVSQLKLGSLPYWGGDGRNHVLLNLARRDLSPTADKVFGGINTGRAIIVQSSFDARLFRPGFDLLVPPILGAPGGDVWQECGPMVPARRTYLLTFQGELIYDQETRSWVSEEKLSLDEYIREHLKEVAASQTQDRFLLQFTCDPATEQRYDHLFRDWSLCGTDSSRRAVLRDSTFVLILSPGQEHFYSTAFMQARLYEALRSGAIPVILGGDSIGLPYAETVEWRRAAILLPKVRITELHFFLRSISDADLMAMRRQGRMLWEKYFSSVQANVDSVVASLRDRLGIPPRPIPSVIAQSVFNESFVQLRSDPSMLDTGEQEESLGPLEPPYPSPAYRRNYTTFLVQSREAWNDWGDPFNLYPQLPFDPVLPSDAKFLGSAMGFRPIAKGAGGAGKEFSEALGGNHPREQFTIVILTYEREQVLMDALARLYGLPYLHKVVVVWNSLKPPPEDLRWPEIGVPVVVVKAHRNSLNNRFAPWDAIETEAVLSVDDDAYLRHDEIIFGFRVWRENRDRVVGFPGRFHAWDVNTNEGWNYNSNYSCELSMVLTGAAFVHKYYLYVYTFGLPQAIREKVDEFMNCEDIAMNFLVANVTNKPPIKVAPRKKFKCPECKNTEMLSADLNHMMERSACINRFASIYGRMPLKSVEYRADPVLFKDSFPEKLKRFNDIGSL